MSLSRSKILLRRFSQLEGGKKKKVAEKGIVAKCNHKNYVSFLWEIVFGQVGCAILQGSLRERNIGIFFLFMNNQTLLRK